MSHPRGVRIQNKGECCTIPRTNILKQVCGRSRRTYDDIHVARCRSVNSHLKASIGMGYGDPIDFVHVWCISHIKDILGRVLAIRLAFLMSGVSVIIKAYIRTGFGDPIGFFW